MKTKAILFGLIILMVSCNKNTVFSELDEDFTDNRWEKAAVKEFDFTIEDDAKLYDFSLLFSHLSDYQFNTIPVQIKIEGPEGAVENLSIDLQINEESGKQLSDCSGDYCDSELKIKEKTRLTKGNYKVSISHTFGGPYLPNVLGVGLKVKKSE